MIIAIHNYLLLFLSLFLYTPLILPVNIPCMYFLNGPLSHKRGCAVIHWSVGNLPVITSRKNDSFFQ